VNDGHLESVEQPEGPDDNESSADAEAVHGLANEARRVEGQGRQIANEATPASEEQPGISLSYIYQLLNGTRKDLGRDKRPSSRPHSVSTLPTSVLTRSSWTGSTPARPDLGDPATPEGAEMERLLKTGAGRRAYVRPVRRESRDLRRDPRTRDATA